MRAVAERPIRTLHDSIKLRNYLEFVLRDARSNKIVKKGKTFNTVTCWGRGWALARLTPASNAQVLSWLAIGSNSATAPASNQSQLVSYATIKAFGTTGLTTSTNAACTFTGAVSFASNETFSGSNQIGEFAVYNSSLTTDNTNACMFNRLTTSTYINFATSNTLAITITITN